MSKYDEKNRIHLTTFIEYWTLIFTDMHQYGCLSHWACMCNVSKLSLSAAPTCCVKYPTIAYSVSHRPMDVSGIWKYVLDRVHHHLTDYDNNDWITTTKKECSLSCHSIIQGIFKSDWNCMIFSYYNNNNYTHIRKSFSTSAQIETIRKYSVAHPIYYCSKLVSFIYRTKL